MKIAIYHNLPSGGGKRQLFEHISRMNRDHEFTLFRIDDDRNESYLDLRPLVADVRSYTFSPKRLPLWLKGVRAIEPIRDLNQIIAIQKQIAQDIDSGHFDVVIVEPCMYTQTPALLSYLKTPSVYFAHEPRRASFEYDFLRTYPAITSLSGLLRGTQQRALESLEKRTDMIAAKSTPMMIANSYYSSESLYRAYGKEAQVCYLGINTKDFRLIPQESTSPSLLAVGALHPAKGPMLTIEALGLLSPEARPSIVYAYDRAKDGYQIELQKRADELGVAVAFKYRISDEELTQEYNQALAVMCCAHLEPFGFTPLEAMACGTPVIAVKEGGFRETVIDGVNGYLVDRNPASVAHAISQLHSKNIFDATLLRAYVETQWSWPKSVERLNELLLLATNHQS
jgi:glycosyltransferase involved in cell wall biosynthesis